MKIDPYNNQGTYVNWKNRYKEIPNISKANSDIIKQYLHDMEYGINVSATNKKGARSYGRLNSLKDRMIFLAKQINDKFKVDVINVKEEQLFNLFTAMRKGEIRKHNGDLYKSVRDFVQTFKAFWHWYQKVNRKQGKIILDITVDLDASREKPKWCYLTEDQVKKLSNNAKYVYKVLIIFLFDTGIRSPTELLNIKISDIFNFKELHIRDEISKTFGRRIKLMICSDVLKEYVKDNNLGNEDYLFKLNPKVVNRYLKRLAKRVFGDEMSLAGKRYSEITMYDLRHISCCYWLPRYKSENALKYRFGWKKSDKIHYYSELLGMKDTISEDDLFLDTTKTEIEKRLEKSENEKSLMKERMESMERQMSKILELTNEMYSKIR